MHHTVATLARQWGVAPKVISDYLYHYGRQFDADCPVISGRRIIPLAIAPKIKAELQRFGKLPAMAAAK